MYEILTCSQLLQSLNTMTLLPALPYVNLG